MSDLQPGFDPRTRTYRDPPPPRSTDPWGWFLGGSVEDGLASVLGGIMGAGIDGNSDAGPLVANVLDPRYAGSFPVGTGGDDTPAFVAAAAGALTVLVPAGTYRVSALALARFGHRLVGVGSQATIIQITGTGYGISLLAPFTEVCGVQVVSAAGVTPTALVTVGGNAGGFAVDPLHMVDVMLDGVDKTHATIGLFLAGVFKAGSHGVYNGRYDGLYVQNCSVGIQAQTIDGSGNPVNDTTKQKNASHVFIDPVIINCVKGIAANTALDYEFCGSDIESNTTGVSVEHVQSWVFIGGFGVQGNTTNWATTSAALSEVLVIGGASDGSAIAGGMQFLGDQGATGRNVITNLQPGQYPGDPGTLGRVWALGLNAAVHNYEATSALTSTNNNSVANVAYQPTTTEVPVGATSGFLLTAWIVGQADTNGNSGAFCLMALFTATNTAGTITTAQVGTTTTLFAQKSDAAWSAAAATTGGNAFTTTAAGKAGDGTIRWEFWTQIVKIVGHA